MIFLLLLFSTYANYPNWLEFIDEYHPITNILIPGSYQSGIFISSYENPYQSQNISIDEQLMIGVRFFDINLYPQNNQILIITSFNNFSSSYNYNDVQSIFINFLDKYPSEFIILKISNYYGNYDNFITALSNNIKNNSKYYFQNKEIPLVKYLRKKIYILQNYTNNTAIYFNYSNIMGYDNVFIENCNHKTIMKQYNNIETSINNSIDKEYQTIYLTFNVGFQNYKTNFTDYSCNILYTSQIYNPLTYNLIENVNDNIYGIIALSYINLDYTKLIILKNTFYMKWRFELGITLLVSLYLIMVSLCVFICCYPTNMWILKTLIACFHTTLQIFQMYYYFKIASYRDFNTKISSYNMFLISISLFSSLIFCDILFLIYFESKKYLKSGALVQNPSINNYNYNFNFRKNIYIDMIQLDSFKKYAFIFFAIYGNCYYFYKMVYIRENCKFYYNYTYVFMLFLKALVHCALLMWNSVMLFMFYFPFAIPFLLFDCIILSLIVFILKIDFIRIYLKIN